MHATESQIPALPWLLVIQGIANFTAHLRSPTQDLLGHKSILHNSQATAVRANDDAAFFSLYLNKKQGRVLGSRWIIASAKFMANNNLPTTADVSEIEGQKAHSNKCTMVEK